MTLAVTAAIKRRKDPNLDSVIQRNKKFKMVQRVKEILCQQVLLHPTINFMDCSVQFLHFEPRKSSPAQPRNVPERARLLQKVHWNYWWAQARCLPQKVVWTAALLRPVPCYPVIFRCSVARFLLFDPYCIGCIAHLAEARRLGALFGVWFSDFRLFLRCTTREGAGSGSGSQTWQRSSTWRKGSWGTSWSPSWWTRYAQNLEKP